MAKKTFRQLVNELKWTPQQEQEIMQLLGIKSGGEMVDEDEVKAKLQKRPQAPRPQQPQSGGNSGAPVMFQEVAADLQGKLENVAQRMRVQAHEHLERRVADLIVNTPLSEVRQESPSGNFDFFSVVDGQHFDQWATPALGGSSSATPQLEASKQPSSPTLTTPSTSAPVESPLTTPPSQT